MIDGEGDAGEGDKGEEADREREEADREREEEAESEAESDDDGEAEHGSEEDVEAEREAELERERDAEREHEAAREAAREREQECEAEAERERERQREQNAARLRRQQESLDFWGTIPRRRNNPPQEPERTQAGATQARRETPAGSSSAHAALRMRRSTTRPENVEGLRSDEESRRFRVRGGLRTVRRTLTAQRPGQPQPQPVRGINPHDLTGLHSWRQSSALRLNFAAYAHGDGNTRTDMQRLRDMERVQGRSDAAAEFEAYADTHRWFIIPDSIRADRTLARDEHDATYVDMMDGYLALIIADGRTAEFFNMHNIPLVTTGDALVGR